MGDGVPNAEADISGHVGRGVECLVGAHPGNGGADHVADRVAAGFPGGQTNLSQQPQHFRAFRQGYVMELDVLPGSDVTFLEGGVPLANVTQHIEGFMSEYPAGYFHPYHLDVGLALPVDSLAKPEGSKFSVVRFTSQELARLRFETLNLFFHVRDDPWRGLSQLHTLFVDIFLVDYLGTVGWTCHRGLLKLDKI